MAEQVGAPADDKRPVLIVGAGPTGATLALLLAQLGVESLVVEQQEEPRQHPAACILNTRTMEVFRQLGLHEEIAADCQDPLERANILWVTSLGGRELGRCSALPERVEDQLALSACHTTVYPQHRLEPRLWARLAAQSLIDFRPGWRFQSLRAGPRQVTATMAGPAGREEIAGACLVGCDGASSSVRQAAGISFPGELLQHMMGVHFEADLADLVGHRPGILYWVLNPRLMGVLIGHWLPTEWVLYAPFFPPQERLEDFQPDSPRVRQLIVEAVGRLPADLKIRAVRPWTMTACLADRFQSGPVLLAGDAAHTFPPTGGLGLNTGVQDAHNLAWKLAAVRRGRAPLKLLATYQAERRPVAGANLKHSVDNYWKMNELNRVVGVDARRLDLLRRVQRSAPFRLAPSALQRALLRLALRAALRRLKRLDQGGPRGERFRRTFCELIPRQEPHYRFLGLDLGFVYQAGAVVPEPPPRPAAPDPVVDYRPTTWSGSRLPHFWVSRGGSRRAIHDLVPPDAYLLLTHGDGRDIWQPALGQLERQPAFPVRCLSIGGPGCDWLDEDGAWRELSEVEPTGAVLVRPDGHVAWRSRAAPSRPAAALAEVLRQLMILPDSRRP